MRRVRRYPDSAQRRDHPNALLGAHGHHAFRREEQLVLGMGVLRNRMPGFEVGGDTGNFGEGPTVSGEEDAVALMRHFLSQ